MVGHIDIHGEIGSRVTLESVKSQIIPNADGYIVHLSSEGGDVYEGIKIYHELKKLKNLTVVVEGLAASIATLIMQAGEKVVALRPSDIMIHNPYAGLQGDSKDFIAAAEQLDRIKATLISVYKKRTNLNDTQLAEMMDKETWLNADEAMAAGLVDEVQDRLKAVAKFDLNKFKMENTLTKDEAKGMIDGLWNKFQDFFKTVKIKNLDATLQDGTAVIIDTEDPNVLQDKKITLADGSAPPDGPHKLSDGRIITVAGGIITAVQPAQPEDEMNAQEAQALKAENEALKAKLAEATGAAAKAAEEVAATNRAMLEFKNKFEVELKEIKNRTFGDPIVPGANPNAGEANEGFALHPVLMKFHNHVGDIWKEKGLVKN